LLEKFSTTIRKARHELHVVTGDEKMYVQLSGKEKA
jgi:hypothetical protein